jgi:RNA polymerase sigma factor (sigma-70 family)
MHTASLWGQPSRSLVEDLVQVTYLKLWEGGCRLLRDFAIQRPDAILGYLKKTAANATHDYFKHRHSQSSGGHEPHVSTSNVDPQAGDQAHGSEQRIAFGIFLNEIDEYLTRCLAGTDQERDRMIFWLDFRQGMSTKEIASLPTIGLGPKGESVPMAVRQSRLGHSDARTTMLYTHVVSEDGKQFAARLGELLTAPETVMVPAGNA